MFAIAVHGGSGTLKYDQMTESLHQAHETALKDALSAGVAVLKNGGSSLDAVQKAVVFLEDCELFNEGKGSVYNAEGKHEMDAAVMEGHTKAAGAVAGVSNIKNPIQLARAILNEGSQVFLSGTKAEEFAHLQSLNFAADDYFQTDFR